MLPSSPEYKKMKALAEAAGLSLSKEEFVNAFKSVVRVLEGTRRELHKRIETKLEEVRGEDGKDGRDGKDGKDGKSIVGPKGDKGDPGQSIVGPKGEKGKDGKDGSPDTGDQIIQKINKGNLYIKPYAIEGLVDLKDELRAEVANAKGGKVGWGAHPLKVSENGAVKDKNTRHISFKSGATVTRRADGVVEVDITGGGGGGGTWGSITGTLSAQTDLQNALDAKADALTADENYVSDAQLTVIGNTSGTNSGDVTLTGEDYLSLTGQQITANPIDLDNLSATGTPDNTKFLRGDNTWATPSGSGDMAAAVYDPQAIAADVFDTDNHTDGTTNKVFTATEKTKLGGIETSADVTDAANVGAVNAAAASKATPVDADSYPIVDSEASNVIKRLTFTNLKAFLKTYFDTLYAATLGADDNYVTDAEKTKLSNISITQAVDLDALETASHAALTVTDSSEIDLALTGQDLTATLKASSIDESKLDASVNASLDLADSALQASAIGVSVQAYDADLTTWAGITPGTGIAAALATNTGSAGAPVLLNGALGTPSSGTLTNATGLPLTGLTSDTTTALGLGSINLGHASDTTLARSSAGNVSIEGNVIYRAGGTDVPVADGGTGRSTSTTAYGLIAAGTTATGAHQTLAAGLTTQLLVGGGASALPVWTTATGTGAPVREGSPALTGTPTAPTAVAATNTTQIATTAHVFAERTNAATITNKRPQPRTSSSTSNATLTPDLSVANKFFRTTQTTGLTIDAPTGTPIIGETIEIRVSAAGAQTLTMNAAFVPFGAAFPASLTAGKDFLATASFNGTNWATLWSNAV